MWGKRKEVVPEAFPKIGELRKAKKLTLESLSEATGISSSQIARYEKGQRNITIPHLYRLAEALGVRLVDLRDSDRPIAPPEVLAREANQ
jgi:transcriptional regulator with XRE-family HTH domain